MPQGPTDRCTGQWAQFAKTGSVYDYLNFKQLQAQDKEADAYADRDQRAGAAHGEAGGGGPDPDDPHA